MKTKVGTVIDENLFRKLKEKAAHDEKTISDIIQDALTAYFRMGSQKKNERLDAVKRLCSNPFNLSKKELQEILNEDYYDQ